VKVVIRVIAAAMVAGSVLACSGDTSVADCGDLPAPADGISGITSVEAGMLREVRFGVQADGSGGEVFLEFEATAADAPIGLSDLALRVNYQIDTETTAGKEGTGGRYGVLPVARASCIAASRQVQAALAGVAVSPLPDETAAVFFEQVFIPDTGEYLVIKPDSGVDADGYIMLAGVGPVEAQLVIDLRDTFLPLDTTEVFISLTTISGGVLMASADVVLVE